MDTVDEVVKVGGLYHNMVKVLLLQASDSDLIKNDSIYNCLYTPLCC